MLVTQRWSCRSEEKRLLAKAERDANSRGVEMAGNTLQTRQQRRAQLAYSCVSSRSKGDDEYGQLAKKFPALVHNCGLAQSIAFVQAKEGATGDAYISHLTQVMGETGDLGSSSRRADLMNYQRLTREAIESATWIKRYSEALLE